MWVYYCSRLVHSCKPDCKALLNNIRNGGVSLFLIKLDKIVDVENLCSIVSHIILKERVIHHTGLFSSFLTLSHELFIPVWTIGSNTLRMRLSDRCPRVVRNEIELTLSLATLRLWSGYQHSAYDARNIGVWWRTSLVMKRSTRYCLASFKKIPASSAEMVRTTRANERKSWAFTIVIPEKGVKIDVPDHIFSQHGGWYFYPF